MTLPVHVVKCKSAYISITPFITCTVMHYCTDHWPSSFVDVFSQIFLSYSSLQKFSVHILQIVLHLKFHTVISFKKNRKIKNKSRSFASGKVRNHVKRLPFSQPSIFCCRESAIKYMSISRTYANQGHG